MYFSLIILWFGFENWMMCLNIYIYIYALGSVELIQEPILVWNYSINTQCILLQGRVMCFPYHHVKYTVS